ncbi:MAG: zinc ribbon domain-containing protein, partial [Eubacteriales bacterium]|nr:zinc ribbon domain-containing protein [Eubacteriales bacterium]
MFCSNCGAQLEPNQLFCSSCGQPVKQPENQSMGQQPGMYENPIMEPDLPMKWYKFISYVQLPLSALLYLGLGIQVMTGAHYGESSRLVYAFFSSLKTIDIIFGLIYLLLMAGSVLVCAKMINRKKNAVTWYLSLQGVSIVIAVLYSVLVYAVTQLSDGVSTMSSSTIASVIM